MKMIIDEQDFLSLISKHGLPDLLNKFMNHELQDNVGGSIKLGCHLLYLKYEPIVYRDISVNSIVGQVGVFSDCGDGYCCRHPIYSYSTWVSAINHSIFDEMLEQLRENPRYYLNEMNKPLEFYTKDDISYYSQGCSQRAIIAKLFLSLYNNLFGTDILLKNVVVKKISTC